jgi:hypothetical protein
MKDDQLEAAISGVDLVCATDWSRSELVSFPVATDNILNFIATSAVQG